MSEFTFDTDLFSDFFKDTVGFRPRNHRFYHPDTTDAEKQEIWDDLMVSHSLEMDRLECAQVQAEIDYQKLIEKMIDTGAKDRKTAIRWILDGTCDVEDLMYGFSYIVYELNISYDHKEEIQPIIDDMLENHQDMEERYEVQC